MLNMCVGFDQPLERWNTGKVREMSGTFSGCAKFNQPLVHFDTSNVENMSFMFMKCAAFNQPLVWDTSKVKDMRMVFWMCPKFNQPLKWDTRAVVDMYLMFYGCAALESVMEFDMSNVTERDDMFGGCGPGARVIDVGMAARLAALENLKLKEEEDKEVADDDHDLCELCSSRKARVLINHKGPVGERGPHRSCGACIHEWITTKWGKGEKVICPFCRAEFKLSGLQKTAFGRYARKACGHKRRAAEYRNLHRVGLADAHDARAREYALGAARVLGAR
jgi:surface protein